MLKAYIKGADKCILTHTYIPTNPGLVYVYQPAVM